MQEQAKSGHRTGSFHWRKGGRIFVADGRYDWMESYAQCPCVLVLPQRLRIYYTCRPKPDASGQFISYTSFIDVDKREPSRILHVHDRPVLTPGGLGEFDQFGAMPGCVLRTGSNVRLYYVGWSRTHGVPYDAAIGLAVSRDDGVTFERHARGPIMAKTPLEPFLQGSSSVVLHDGIFHTIYLSGTEWIATENSAEPIYLLMHATSTDGIHWVRDGKPCVPTLSAKECQASPSLIRRDNQWHLWFSYRRGVDFRNADGGYRIGYAVSEDLTNWFRDDGRSDLDRSESGWDSEMVCYPCVIDVDGMLHMFYSGNYFGRDGFGYARLDC
jgi:hypothetical protein